jgi:hypothetical protein
MRLNDVAAHTAAASVQDTSCSAVGGTGQVLDGSRQREEECALQRFQRLFPARISARLVAHTVGRRASESALSSSIIHMYHRLLGERQELVAAGRQFLEAPAGTEASTLQAPFADAFLGDLMEEEGPAEDDAPGFAWDVITGTLGGGAAP